MIDFHCHLDLYPDPYGVAEEVQRRGVGVLSVTTTPAAWRGTRRLSERRPMIRTALGFHPELAATRSKDLELFDEYLGDAEFVGEVGLDGSPELLGAWDMQVRAFEHVLRSCARAGGRVLSVHSRRAGSQVLDCLVRHPDAGQVLLHWFSGTKGELRTAIERGYRFSVGPAMLAGARGRSHVAEIPRSHVVLETDGPFARHQRQPMQPWDVARSLQPLAEIWGLSADEVAEQIRRNEIALLGSIA